MKFCPHCGGDVSSYLAAEGGARTATSSPTTSPLPPPGPYVQEAIWRRLVSKARSLAGKPTLAELVDDAILPLLSTYDWFKAANNAPMIVHLVFDQSVIPNGGMALLAAKSEGQAPLSAEQFQSNGYLVVDGKVAHVDGMPVGECYGAIQYWGGEKQFKRWHMTRPVEVEPSRNGNPFFMDAEMVAFGVFWRDPDKIREAMMTLLSTFTQGVKGDKPIANPLVLEITPI